MLWITGAKGLLGSALVTKCKAALHNGDGAPNEASSLGSCIAALHNPNEGALQTGKEVDIADRGAVERFLDENRGVRHIVNCAAFSQVDAAEKEREAAYRANAVGPEVLGGVAKERGIRLIHISTDYVFDGKGRRPLKESDPVGPCNYYGVTKLEGERRALAQGACVIRTSGIFGDGGKNFVSKLLGMLQKEREIRLTQDQWGRFTYAPDLAGAILQMFDQTGLYQYANSGVVSKYEFALAMRDEARELGFPVMTESILAVDGSTFASPCKRPVYSAFDTEKIEALVSIRPWREALREFLCAKSTASL